MLIKQALKTIEEIPVFVEDDWYVKNYDQISTDHLEMMEEGKHFIDEKLWIECENATRNLITKYSSAGDKILDVGVGLGRLIQDLDLEKYGVDISLEYLKIAKDKNIQCYKAKVEDLPFDNGSFDVIVCTDVLEHVLDFNRAILEMKRVLKTDGYLIIRVPYREDLSHYLADNYPYYSVHLRNFDENKLQLLLTRVFQLAVVQWETCGYSLHYSKFKHRNNIHFFDELKRKLLLIIRRLKWYNLLNHFVYRHEINIVVQKTENSRKDP